MEVKPEIKNIEIKAEDRKQEEKKKKVLKTCPLKGSQWFITINTNIYINDKTQEEAEDVKKRFADYLAQALPRFADFVEMKTSKQGLSFGYSGEDPRDILSERIKCEKLHYVIEISPSGRPHAHIDFYLKKRGVDTKINTKKIKEDVDANMGISCYVNYKLCSTQSNLEEYMKKNPVN